jgi:hypothetical protein
MERIEWTPESHNDQVLTIRIGGPRFVFTMLVFADDAARTLVCTGVLPILVDADRRRAVAEVIVRINRGLRLGTFDLDLGDGELRYRIGCDVEGGALTEHMVMTMLGNVGASIERFGPALMQVVFGQATPEDAARAALGGDDAAEE